MALIRSGTQCCKLWQTFLSIFNPQPRSLRAGWTLWSRSMGGLSQDQDASYRAALCCLSEGRRLRGFPLILCWRIWEGPLLMIMMLRPIAESQAGARPCSHSHSYTSDIKGWPAEGWTGQMDLVGRLWIHVNLSRQMFFFFLERMLLMQQWCVFVCACVCECVYAPVVSSITLDPAEHLRPLSRTPLPPVCLRPLASVSVSLSLSLSLSNRQTHTHIYAHLHTSLALSLSHSLWQATVLEMAADILDSKRLKVECVCVCLKGG